MTNSLSRKLFLLGGHDLEMMTIKQMLEGMDGCVTLDKELEWSNAKLSAYEDELKWYVGENVFGIELQEDIPLPPRYHRIDHHNDWADRPSALEQVAEIVDVELSRYQQLVAANDKGYIPAMKALGATDEEVVSIRRDDRAAQGVTEQEERLAEQSVSEHLTRYDSLLVVKALSSKFSPICDRLFPYHSLLIYTEAEWVFYGEGKPELVLQYAEDIKQKRIYHGGGTNGYIGCVSGAYNKVEIEKMVKQIIKHYEHI